MWSSLLFGILSLPLSSAQETGNHPEWPRWCGKVYMPEYPSFDPGGQTTEPPLLPEPALYMQFRPRWSIYLESETSGSFIVDAAISDWHGEAWPNLSSPNEAPPVHFTINLVDSNDVLVSANITAGTTQELFAFDLSRLEPRLEAYEVILFGATEDGDVTVTSEVTELFYLPEKTTGSVARLDNLNGGLSFRNTMTEGKFIPLLPYGFYASCDNFLCEDDSLETIRAYHDLGLNGMVPLTTIFDSRPEFQLMDELDLKFMYDLRAYYQNLTAVEEQVSAVKDFEALYAYWGSDEPDGHQDPFNATVLSRSLIRSIDPYHPVSVTLNCQDYYFGPYTRSADFIMEDAYPIGVNGTFSKWGTECNTTYGDCGCDNCQGNVQDVPSRLDDLATYEAWLGLWPKTKAHNPQSFHGEGYWLREPTVDEAVVMNALAFNHDAKAIVSWVWPTSDDLAVIHGALASVVTRSPVVEFVVAEKANRLSIADLDIVDVAYWVQGGEMLLSVVNGGYDPIEEEVVIPLPESISPGSLTSVIWGDAPWTVGAEVKISGMGAMSTNIIIIQL